MATWCLITGQTPETYRSLPRRQRNAFVDAVVKINKRRR